VGIIEHPSDVQLVYQALFLRQNDFSSVENGAVLAEQIQIQSQHAALARINVIDEVSFHSFLKSLLKIAEKPFPFCILKMFFQLIEVL